MMRRLVDQGVSPKTFTLDDLTTLLPQLESSLRLFVEPARLKSALVALRSIAGDQNAPRIIVQSVMHERDIGVARSQARGLCELGGARPLTTQRAATIVSELARNIFKYAGEGRIELALRHEGGAKLHVVASDNGPGIPHLDEVLAGRHESKTGLGKGLLGVKRLAEEFEIDTGPSGTRVEVVVHL
jgi:serine/threonine-protein kinase RsbT